ncbi:MAG: hypothetical protein AB7G75_36930 [Candidatus Binatia bacterium]
MICTRVHLFLFAVNWIILGRYPQLQSEIQALESQLKSAKGTEKERLTDFINQKHKELERLKQEVNEDGQDVAEHGPDDAPAGRAP